MRVGVYFEHFEPLHVYKDPGQLVLGFNEVGIESVMVTLPKPSLAELGLVIPIVAVEREWNALNLWRSLAFDYVLMYTWLSAGYVPLQKAVAALGSKVLLKADVDGRTFLPSVPAILAAHGVIVESPLASTNVAHLLHASGNTRAVNRLFTIPNPVSPQASRRELGEKRPIVVAVGRWEGGYQKNTPTMVSALMEFLDHFPHYEAVIVGTGGNLVRELVDNATTGSSARGRVHIPGELPHEDLMDLLVEARTLFSASRFEGFSIAAAEAVCLGCTVVAPPLECFQYLSMGGMSGTLAPDWTPSGLVAALVSDSLRWEREEYDYLGIARAWRKTLDRKAVALSYRKVLDCISG